MLHKIIIVVLYVFLSIFNSCSDNTIEIKPVKDPRTYTWTADTLGYPNSFQTLMYDMWGSSPKDVYAVGHNSQNSGLMWHFDGYKWTSVKLITSEGGQIDGAIDLKSIYGLSATDIYAVGSRILGYNPNPPPTFESSQLIIHYDGSAWREVNVDRGDRLVNIYGNSPSDIWSGGLKNTLYHYNGSRWIKDSVNISIPEGFDFQIGHFSSHNSTVYLGANSNNNKGTSIYYLFKRTNNTWETIDSFYEGNTVENFGPVLNQSKIKSFYSSGNWGVYKYNGTSWDNILRTTNSYITGIWGSGDENLFAVGNRGTVYHYNGTDWKRIEELNDPQIDYWAVWTDGTEAFVAGSIFADGLQKTIVWHGK